MRRDLFEKRVGPPAPNDSPFTGILNSTRGLRLKEALLIAVLGIVVFFVIIVRRTNFWESADSHLDNPVYTELSVAIQAWDFSSISELKAFWGLPYVMAAVSSLFHIPDINSLVLISCVTSLLTVAFAYQLWGGWVAATFAVVNWEWIRLSTLGGTEPLFMSLLSASLLAARKNKWLAASALAALSTTVRPIGIFALAALAFELLRIKQTRTLMRVTALGLAIGLIYVLPFWIRFGRPAANVQGYVSTDAIHHRVLTVPLLPIIFDIFRSTEPLRTKLASTVSLIVCLAAIVAAVIHRKKMRFARVGPVELYFVVFYSIFLLCFNVDYVFTELPRYVIPLMPVMLVSLERWLPQRRAFIYGMAPLSGYIAAGFTIGFRNAFTAFLPVVK